MIQNINQNLIINMKIDIKIINDFKLFLTPQFIKIMESGNLELKNYNDSEIENVLLIIYDNYCRLVTLKNKLIDSKEYKHIFITDDNVNKGWGFKNFEIPEFERLDNKLVIKLTPTISYVYEVLLFISDEYVSRKSNATSYKTEVLELFDKIMNSYLNNLDKDAVKKYRKIWGSKYPNLFSHVLFKKINNDLNNFCMVSKFSGLSRIKDKNKHKMLNAKLITLESQNILDIEGAKNRVKFNLESNLNFNKNKNLSGVGSVVYLRASELLGNLQNLIFHNDDKKCYNQILNLNELNIKSIFIIHDGIERMNVKGEIITPLPSFNQLYPKYTNNEGKLYGAGIKINFLSLDDFCIIYSTLKYERKRIRAIRSQEINFQKNKNHFSFENKNSYYYHNFLYYLDLNADIDNSIFCFVDSNWSKIRGKLLGCGIDINRGESVKRGTLSPINYELSLFLNKFSKNAYRDITTSFNFKDKVNSHDKDYSNNYSIENYDDNRIFQMMNSHINNIEKVIKNKLISKFNIDLLLLDDKEFIRSLYDLCVKEVLFSSYFITDDIISSIFVNYLDQITDDGETLLSKFSSLNYKNHPNKGVFQKLINPQQNQKREYSTNVCASCASRNLKNNKLNTDNNSKNKDKFYDSLRDIILQAKENPVETQRKIEKEWINILIDDVNKEQNFIRSKLSKIVKNATEGSNTDEFKNILRKSYGDLSDYLVNDKNVLITLIEIADSYRKSKRSAIAKNIGYSMMRELFSLLVINKIQRVNNTPKIEATLSLSLKNTPSGTVVEPEELEEYVLSLNEFIELIAYYSNSKVKITDIIDLKSQYVLEYLGRKKEIDNHIIYKNSSTNFLVTIGTRFIELFSNRVNSVFIEISAVGEGSNNDSKLVLNDEYKDLEDKFGKMILQPKNLPMVCTPGEWGPNKYGGYLENKIIQEKIVTGSIKYNAHEYKNLDMLYNTINYFNNIQFGINNSLLEFIEGEGSYLLPTEDKEALYNFNISIKIANLFKNIPFYLNTHADWRGRLYTHCFYISYQGSEISSALLQFWNGEPLTETGLNIFYAFGASIFSTDNNKNNEEYRINWVKNNKSKILNMNPEFIREAESPVSFAAFCLEMRKLEENRNVEIKMPVFIDATCSGIQHIAALIGDTELATKVNLIPNIVKHHNKPDDIYQSLVDPINNAINEYGRNNSEFNALSNLYLTRKELKQPIMTLNYNVSVFGMKEQLYNSLKVTKSITENEVFSANEQNLKIKEVTKIIGKTKDKKEIELSNRDLIKIAMIIKENIFIHYPALKAIYDYFLEVAMFMKKLELPVQWVTPTGAEITQKYTKKEKIKLRIYLHKKTKTRVLYNSTNKIDYNKQIDGIIPNVIHSLDSSHIIKLINVYGKSFKFGILTVHDCFGTHPNHVESLFFCLKEEFISLYINRDFLKKFDNSIIKTINCYYNNNVEIKDRVVYKTVLNIKNNTSEVVALKIPTPPKKKDLQYDLIRYSKWMFN